MYCLQFVFPEYVQIKIVFKIRKFNKGPVSVSINATLYISSVAPTLTLMQAHN
jgi:hypothetical protein